MTETDLDASRPRRAPHVYTVDVDGEAILLDQADQRLHQLNASAALLWARFDGTSTIAEIAAAVSEEVGVAREILLQETIDLALRLTAEGLLDGVPTETRWRRHPDVLWRRSMDAVVFSGLREEEPRVLAGTGPALWDLLAEARSARELVGLLAATYAVDTVQLEDDVRSTLSTLVGLQAVEPVAPDAVESPDDLVGERRDGGDRGSEVARDEPMA